jgi:hypothetical protein
MAYHRIEPEVAGELGEGTDMDTSVHPPNVRTLHYEITDWLGDHILESYPVYIVSEQLAEALTRSAWAGSSCATAGSRSRRRRRSCSRARTCPSGAGSSSTGVAGQDHFGVTDNARLVVSDEGLDVLNNFSLSNALIEPYD